ncbi:MAG: helix-turn-helix transcriptional regulator [Oscillospiraceae bacterium]|nr:helix-turn-helix transcriptional regulator [Oscillospiraceae bacterium]
MQYDASAFAITIRTIRKERGLTQEVLSGLAGIARSHLSMIETGDKVASVETLWKIANALDMRLSALVQQAENRMRPCENEPK